MLVGICGLKWNGKTTSAQYLAGRYGFMHTKFAAPLKDMIRTMLRSAGLDDETVERKIEGDLKELPCEILGGHTPVHAMQTLGTEWGRNCISPTLWGDLWEARAQWYIDNGCSVVVDDVRFENEYQRVKRMGGYIVHLVGRSSVVNGHVSEDLSWLVDPDFIVENNSTPDHLLRQLDRVVANIKEDVEK